MLAQQPRSCNLREGIISILKIIKKLVFNLIEDGDQTVLPILSAGRKRDWSPYQIFKKRDRTSILRQGYRERGGWTFPGGYNFYIKNKLNSEIFNA